MTHLSPGGRGSAGRFRSRSRAGIYPSRASCTARPSNIVRGDHPQRNHHLMQTLSTIGYEATTIPGLIRALTDAGIELLVDGLLCFEEQPAHCHRTLAAAALASRIPVETRHLEPVSGTEAALQG